VEQLWHQKTMVAWGLACSDFAFILTSYGIAVHLTTPLEVPLGESFIAYAPYLIILLLVWFSAAIERRLWSFSWSEGIVSYMTAVVKAAGDATLYCVVFMALFTNRGLDHNFLVTYCFITFFVLLLFRFSIRLLLRELRRMGYQIRKTIVIGANNRTAHLLEVFQSQGGDGYQLLGVVDDDAERLELLSAFKPRYLGGIHELEKLLKEEPVDTVFVGLPVRSNYHNIQEIAHYCEGAGVTVNLLADLFPMRIATNRQMYIDEIPLLSLSTIPEAHLKLAFKRLFDLVVSTLLIIALSPMFLLVAILIKLDSKGPLLFFQERVGQNQRRFRMIKFRSMVVNAEELRAKLVELNEADGPVFKMRNDPRITRVGRFIRKYSIDEFPQLFNVWWGEMSLVGPRPPIPAEVAEYTWDQRRRLSVKPGMTGLWQVSGRSDVSFQEWVELDLQYIDNWSIAQDFMILLRTFRAVVAGRGAA